MGSHMVMYASDYPHWDCEFPESVRMVASIPGLTDEQKRRVLGRNAITWFGLTPMSFPAPRFTSHMRRPWRQAGHRASGIAWDAYNHFARRINVELGTRWPWSKQPAGGGYQLSRHRYQEGTPWHSD